MRKFIFALVLLVAGFSFSIKAENKSDNKILSEIRNWEWSIGGCSYLVKANTFYYSLGTKRDLGQFFNFLDNERLYFELGYLNSRIIGQNTAGDKEYFFAGISTNANFLVQQGIKGINIVCNSTFKTPSLLDKILATIGVIGAKKINTDNDFDGGVNIAIIKQF